MIGPGLPMAALAAIVQEGAVRATTSPGRIPLQATTDARLVALLLFLGFVLAIVLSVVIAVRGVQGYRRLGDPALLGMAAGILLLSGAPIVLNVTLQTLTRAAAWQVSVVADCTRLLGLVLILYVIYGTGR